MKAAGPIPGQFSPGEEGVLLIGGQPAAALVNDAGGTPLFVYDKAIVGGQVARFRAAMPDGVALHYAVKANPYGSLLTFLAQFVDGFDVASAGEIDILVAAEAASLPVSLAGPGKSDSDLAAAIGMGATVNLESEFEADRALAIAQDLGVTPKFAVRINPPFALKGAGMKMGGLASPFGVDHDRAATLVRAILDRGADWRGLHIFTGSQALDADALIETQRATVALAAEVASAANAVPPEVNLGGGFGIPYFPGEMPLDVERIGAELAETIRAAPDILAQQPALEMAVGGRN
jgi:diaminopimelate decarboxylase